MTIRITKITGCRANHSHRDEHDRLTDSHASIDDTYTRCLREISIHIRICPYGWDQTKVLMPHCTGISLENGEEKRYSPVIVCTTLGSSLRLDVMLVSLNYSHKTRLIREALHWTGCRLVSKSKQSTIIQYQCQVGVEEHDTYIQDQTILSDWRPQ